MVIWFKNQSDQLLESGHGTNSVVGHSSAQVMSSDDVMKILEEDEWTETIF